MKTTQLISDKNKIYQNLLQISKNDIVTAWKRIENKDESHRKVEKISLYKTSTDSLYFKVNEQFQNDFSKGDGIFFHLPNLRFIFKSQVALVDSDSLVVSIPKEIREVELRSSGRYLLSNVKAELIFDYGEKETIHEFILKDISITGLGVYIEEEFSVVFNEGDEVKIKKIYDQESSNLGSVRHITPSSINPGHFSLGLALKEQLDINYFKNKSSEIDFSRAEQALNYEKSLQEEKDFSEEKVIFLPQLKDVTIFLSNKENLVYNNDTQISNYIFNEIVLKNLKLYKIKGFSVFGIKRFQNSIEKKNFYKIIDFKEDRIIVEVNINEEISSDLILFIYSINGHTVDSEIPCKIDSINRKTQFMYVTLKAQNKKNMLKISHLLEQYNTMFFDSYTKFIPKKYISIKISGSINNKVQKFTLALKSISMTHFELIGKNITFRRFQKFTITHFGSKKLHPELNTTCDSLTDISKHSSSKTLSLKIMPS